MLTKEQAEQYERAAVALAGHVSFQAMGSQAVIEIAERAHGLAVDALYSPGEFPGDNGRQIDLRAARLLRECVATGKEL